MSGGAEPGGAPEGFAGRGRRVEGAVVEERPAAVYAVMLANRHRVLAHVVGAVERNFVRLVPGDRVEVELAPEDPTRGRIVRKLGKTT